MAQDKLPTSKIARATRFIQTGIKVGGSYLKHLGKKMLLQKTDSEDLQRDIAENLMEGFSKLRGTALKLAQMLSMDHFNLSSAFTDVLQKAQYSVPPMSAPLAIQAFKKAIGKSPEQVFDKFNPNAVKAASIGQVHEAWLDGKRLAVKIQYPGVADSVTSDLKMLRAVAARVVNTTPEELKPYMDEIETKLLEETDYALELKTSQEFAALCKDIPGIVFPRYYPEYSSERVITMEWLEGMHMKDFLQTNPSQELKNKLGQIMWDFYDYQIHVLRRMHADPHPGNFLFRPHDQTVGILDFGCTKSLTQELHDNYFDLSKPGLLNDREAAIKAFKALEIIRPDDDPEKQDWVIENFSKLVQLIARPYHTKTFYFNDTEYYDKITEVAKEISKTREIRGNKEYLFINRTFFGLFAIYQELNATLNTSSPHLEFLHQQAALQPLPATT